MRRFFVGFAVIGALVNAPMLLLAGTGAELGPVKIDKQGQRGVAAPKPVPVTERMVVPAGFDTVVLFATNSIKIDQVDGTIGAGANVTGDIVVNNASAGPTLAPGFELSVGKDVVITGNLKANRVELGRNSKVSGQVAFNSLSKATGATTGSESTPLNLPVFAEPPTFHVATPGTTDVTLPGTLPAGRYRNITVTGILTLSGGEYDAQSITVASGSSLRFAAPSQVRVAGRLSAGAGSFLGPASGVEARDIVLFVGGSNGGDGSISGTPAAVQIGQQSTVHVNVYAPNGRIQVDKQSVLVGAFLGRNVKIDRGSSVTRDSFFRNQPPVAFPQDLQTDGMNGLVITLEGSDPEGSSLAFSIPVSPTLGALGAISPVIPAAIKQCSVSRELACVFNPDCPLGETCETVQPPITQATVTYSPYGASNAADAFTFGVTDDASQLGTAIVSINGSPSGPPGVPGVSAVDAQDLEVRADVTEVKVLTLSAVAPSTVASLTFRVETLPAHGVLKDSNSSLVVAGVDLPSQVVTYTAPAAVPVPPAPPTDPFTFSARDSATTSPPCGPPSCDTATVNIAISGLPELAPDQSVETAINTPIVITLQANPGGISGAESTFSPGSVSSRWVTDVTDGDNGPAMTSHDWGRIQDSFIGMTSAVATPLTVGAGWSQFGWCDTATSPTCSGALVSLVNEVEVLQSPFEFTTTQGSCLRVTDALAKGDRWRVETSVVVDQGPLLVSTDYTSVVPQNSVSSTSDPDVAFADASYSSGAFGLAGGQPYSVRLVTIPPDSFAFGSAAFLRVDTGSCDALVWEVTSLPSGGLLTNLNGGALVQVGTTYQYTASPQLVFTPFTNVSGVTSFGYKVTQGGLVGPAVVDTAIVDISVLAQICGLNGRPPECP